MREAWSINALSLELGPDRRTIAKWLERSDVKPVSDGPVGPLYRLRDVVGVLSDASVLGDSERSGRFNHASAEQSAARKFADRLLRALAKRLPAEQRAVRESVAAELFRFVEEREARMWTKRRARLEAPDWASMTAAELGRALRALIDTGMLSDEDASS